MAKASKPHNFLEGEFKLPETEEKVLKFWRDNQIFEKSLAARKKAKTFVFFEGPPGANGRPGIHHVLSRVFKDIIPRYKTMRGYRVPRKSGWDTHGLPVEIAAEKELGLKSKKEIEAYGIAAFNEKCREVVWRYQEEWERLTERIGFWLDLKKPYVTYHSEYIESLWWILKQVADKGLLYKGHKVVPWCPRCGTALSSHELALGYKEVTDQSVFMKFRLRGKVKIGSHPADAHTYILSWTTTPWTLPGNVALAVGEKIRYALVKDGRSEDRLIVAEELVPAVFEGIPHQVEHVFSGSEMIGWEYEPLFDIPELRTERSHRVYPADFVTVTDGTGVVHTAVMYGEEDYELGKAVGLPQFHTVEESGRFKPEMPAVGGLPAKSRETEDRIFEHLRASGTLFEIKDYVHEYPHCWRCDTPLLYYARTSWFVAMSKLRKQLLANNAKINWVPPHIQKGRFGEWLTEVKDWNFSRERYWGTPLPVWECAKCDHWTAVGSIAELEQRAAGAKNGYWVMRHGQAVNNAQNLIDSGGGKFHLTPKGIAEATRSAERFKAELDKAGKQIDLVLASPVLRTKETAEIVARVLGVKRVYFDDALEEIQLGELSGCHDRRYHEQYPTYADKFEKKPENGESLRDLRARLWQFLMRTEDKFEGKNILLVSHDYPIWMLSHGARGWTEREAIAAKEERGDDFIKTGAIEPLGYRSVPRNGAGEIDLHRPFVDAPVWPCAKCGGEMRRVKEVVDVWYDSGAMPLAQGHYPFENRDLVDKGGMYPADYISEGIDQTRGWFYTLLAVATLLDKDVPYRNVICLGLVNDKHGQKMSKSKGNVVDPWDMIGKHGIDAVRWYFFSATPPGDAKNFDELEIVKGARKFHALLYNSFVFYRTYAKPNPAKVKSRHLLDQWILARLAEAGGEVTRLLDAYDVRGAALALEGLADDLSRWYIRRARRRFQKPDSATDLAAASYTLGLVLHETAKLAAPFTPFFAEALYGSLEFKRAQPSVHLADWSKFGKPDGKLIAQMAEVRALASLGLAKRAESGIKVRQPLASMKAPATKSGLPKNKSLLAILAEEVNVKKIIFDKKIKEGVELDTMITPELRAEGTLREVARTVQELRQTAGLQPKDKIALYLDLPEPLGPMIARQEAVLKKEVNARTVEFKRTDKFQTELETKLEGHPAWFALRKI